MHVKGHRSIAPCLTEMPAIYGAQVAQSGAPVAQSGAQVAQSGAPVAQSGEESEDARMAWCVWPTVRMACNETAMLLASRGGTHGLTRDSHGLHRPP